jgi:hypothetical protein
LKEEGKENDVPKKLIPAIEVALSVALMGTIGGILAGVGGAILFLWFPAVPSWVTVLIVVGVFLIVAAIVNALIHDDRVTRMVEATFPLSPEEIKERLRQRAKERG